MNPTWSGFSVGGSDMIFSGGKGMGSRTWVSFSIFSFVGEYIRCRTCGLGLQV